MSLKGLWAPSFYGGFQGNILALCVGCAHVLLSDLSWSLLPFLGDSPVVILSSPKRDDRREGPSQSPCRKVFSDKEGTH